MTFFFACHFELFLFHDTPVYLLCFTAFFFTHLVETALSAADGTLISTCVILCDLQYFLTARAASCWSVK